MTLHESEWTPPPIAAIIVAYNSADALPRLLTSIDRSTVEVRAIVVDNGSADDSVAIARRFSGVTVIATGVNLGYSGGINVGRRVVRPDEAVAILNPDLELTPDALERLSAHLRDPLVGIVAPRLLEPGGARFDSLRREPTVLAAWGDAAFGGHWPRRPRALTETLRRAEEYDTVREVAWAGGAALLISPACNARVGAWDADTYFLYSEETDYAQRARDAGFAVRYEPAAIAYHEGSGSGQPAALVALLSVNRIRCFQRRHGRVASAFFRGGVAASHALRPHDARHRHALSVVLRRSRWSELPTGERLTSEILASVLAPAGGSR